jgi:hypothetical protein
LLLLTKAAVVCLKTQQTIQLALRAKSKPASTDKEAGPSSHAISGESTFVVSSVDCGVVHVPPGAEWSILKKV